MSIVATSPLTNHSGFTGRPVLVIKFQHAFPRQIKDMTEIVLFWVAVRDE